MSENKKEQFKKRMEALLQKYKQQLPTKYLEIKNNWDKYQQDLNNAELSDKFYRLVHTLKGTAATFGFMKQSDICLKVQKLLLEAQHQNKALSENSIELICNYLDELKIHIHTPAEHLVE